MDKNITLRNKNTEQECNFDTQESAQNFADTVEDRDNWELKGEQDAAPVLTDKVEQAAAPAGADDAATDTPA